MSFSMRVPIFLAATFVLMAPQESEACWLRRVFTSYYCDPCVSTARAYYTPTAFARSYYAPTVVVGSYYTPTIVSGSYYAPTVVARSYYTPTQVAACPTPCPTVAACPTTSCTTNNVQRCYYEPQTVYETRNLFEPQVSYVRRSYYNPLSCCYQSYLQPVTQYVERSYQVPVTRYVQRCSVEPVTTCTTSTSYFVPGQPSNGTGVNGGATERSSGYGPAGEKSNGGTTPEPRPMPESAKPEVPQPPAATLGKPEPASLHFPRVRALADSVRRRF